MSGEVLYRKWRPPRFADIVGQGPITQTLTQAIANDRVSHAYLLCGPRGTGKTSTARVLAKSLNCTMRPPGVGDPCGACNNCRAIENGSFVDLIEIDAASNRGIDEMRDLREKVRFAPTLGKNKVYIIDEAHALTNDAFNAFLKTLEEPPPHTVFILATTEPHRLPATIISRCQRFDFHRIAMTDIVERLAAIAQEEGVDASPEVLRLVARTAGGSLRDATNLLDQLITSFGTRLSVEQVRELLGVGGEDRALALVKHLLTGGATQALEVINSVASEGLDLRPLHRMTVDFLRAALLMKSGVSDSLELSKEAQSQLSFAAASVPIEHIMRALRLFGQVSLRFDQPSPLPLELATVELALEPEQAAPVLANQAPAPAAAPQGRPAPGPPPFRPQGAPGQPRPQQPPRRQASPTNAPSEPAPIPAFDPASPVEQRLAAQWPAILKAAKHVHRRKFNVEALLRTSSGRSIDGNTVIVMFTHQSNSERLQSELDDPQCRNEVEKVLEEALGGSFTIRAESAGGESSSGPKGQSPAGHLVQAAVNLGGQVVSKSEDAPPPAPTPAQQAPPEDTSESSEPPIRQVPVEDMPASAEPPTQQAPPEDALAPVEADVQRAIAQESPTPTDSPVQPAAAGETPTFAVAFGAPSGLPREE